MSIRNRVVSYSVVSGCMVLAACSVVVALIAQSTPPVIVWILIIGMAIFSMVAAGAVADLDK